MKIADIIKSRRTIHEYKQGEVSRQLLDQALELALYAPNHKHTQPWKFFVLGNEARETVAGKGSIIKAEAKGKSDNQEFIDQAYKKLLAPTYLVVLGQKKCADELQTKEDYAALACGVQNIQLFLWSHDIGAKWSTGAMTNNPFVYDLLGVSQKEISLEGFLWVGLPEKVGPVPPKAKLSDVLKDID